MWKKVKKVKKCKQPQEGHIYEKCQNRVKNDKKINTEKYEKCEKIKNVKKRAI